MILPWGQEANYTWYYYGILKNTMVLKFKYHGINVVLQSMFKNIMVL